MIFLIRAIPFISTIILLVIFELSLTYYSVWMLWLFLIALIIIITVFLLNKNNFNKQTIGFIIAPVFLMLGCVAFLFFQEEQFIKQLVIFASLLIYLFFVNNIFLFFHRTKSYVPSSLENISTYSNILAAFYIYVSCFSFYVLSVFSIWILIPIVLISTFALAWQTLWINKIELSKFGFFVFITSLIIGEMFWALHYWPTSFFVNGIILTIVYYVIINLARLYFLDSLNRKMVIRYLGISILVLGVTLYTAQWT